MAVIKEQVAQIPPERRLFVTNHESLGYFADRYGFQFIGAVVPSISSEAAPSAQQMAALIDQIKSSGAPAIFLDYISVTADDLQLCLLIPFRQMLQNHEFLEQLW